MNVSKISATASREKTGIAPRLADDLVRSPKRVLMPGNGVVVFESRHAAGFIGQLKDDYAKFHLVIDGHAKWESNGRQYQVKSDTLFHIAPHIEHSQADLPSQPVTLYAIHYRPELLSQPLAADLLRVGMLPLDLSSARVCQALEVRSIFQEMLFEQEMKQAGWEEMLRACLFNLAVLTIRLMQRLHSGDPVFQRGNLSAERVAHYALRLKSQFLRTDRLEDAARSVSLSRRQFTEVFRNVTGQTWRQYILRLRLEHALKLLLQTDKSVTAIAFEAGFDDVSHFHHRFKAAFGQRPMLYREKNRQKEQP